MFHGDLVSELHIQDAGTPGFRKFWKKWLPEAKMPGEGPYYVQFTKPKSADDKRFVGQALGKKDPYEDGPLSYSDDADPKDIETLKELGVAPPDEQFDSEKTRKRREEDLKKLRRMGLEDPTIYKKPDHSDPIGAYVYPLEYVINHPYDIQYGHNMEFLRVLKLRDNTKVLDLQNVKGNQLSQFAKAMGWGDFSGESILNAVAPHSRGRKGNQMAHALWFLIQHEGHLYKTEAQPPMKTSDGVLLSDEETPGGEVKWWGGKGDHPKDNNLYTTASGDTIGQKEQTARIKKFGYDVLKDIDETGTKAVIYHGEPEQALIISRNAFDVVDTYDLRVNKKTSYGAMSYKGIARSVGKERKKFPREVAEKIAKMIGDKIEDTMKMGDVNYNELEGSLSDAVKYLNGDDPLTLAMDSGSDMVQPQFYKTKRGIMAVDVDERDREKPHHRGMGWTDNSVLSLDYIDDRGLSHFKGRDISINHVGKQLLKQHPQLPLKMKEPLSPKDINRAKLAIGTVKVQFEQLQDTMDMDFVQIPKALNDIAQTLGVPTLPTHGDVAEDLGYYALAKGMAENLPPASFANKLGVLNLSLDDDDSVCEQSKDIAVLRDKSEAWFKTINNSTINPEAAKDLKGKADWVYAMSSPGTYLKLHPEAKSIIEIMQWIYIVLGDVASLLDSRKYTTFEGAIEVAKKNAVAMRENKDLWRACSPKNIGHESEYSESIPIKARELVGGSLHVLADSLAGIGHKILKVQAEDEKAQSINRLRDKISDLGFNLKRMLDKTHTPSQTSLDNGLKHLGQHLDEMLQLFHLEDHPTVPEGHGMPDDEMTPIKEKIANLVGSMERTPYREPDWSSAIIGKLRVLAANRGIIHIRRKDALLTAFGDEAMTKWMTKYGNESRLNRRSWDSKWQDAMDAQDKFNKEALTKKAEQQAAEKVTNDAAHASWVEKMKNLPDGPAPF